MNEIATNTNFEIEHPLITEFANLVENTVGDGILDFRDLRKKLFIKFWQHFIIYQHDNSLQDFKVILCGTYVVDLHKRDLTGDMMSELVFNRTNNDIYQENLEVMNDEYSNFISEVRIWENNKHKKYQLIRFPLKRNNVVNEVLTCAVLL